MKTVGVVIFCIVLGVVPGGAWGARPTFQELMDPAQFPEAQRGMKVESVAEKTASVEVTTTGAVIDLNGLGGQIVLHQRIGDTRPVAVLKVAGSLEGLVVTHRGEGFARITAAKPKLTVRVNGDSLFLMQVHEPLSVVVDTKITPAWHASWKTNHLVVDELGGFGLYCSDLALDDKFEPLQTAVAAYSLPADAVLCVGVCPPKPYDWDRSFQEQVVWHWSDKTGYPLNEDLRSWKPYGNVVLLQSEVMLWKDWNLDFVPRLGLDEFARVRKTIHDLGMRFIVYTSPYYFLKGTSQEKQAVNDKPGVSPGAIVKGENMPLFLEAITRVMRDLKPDGLYFDGQYMENPAGLYALARHARRIIGEDGILEWHSTTELGAWGSRMYMPQADAYTDVQLRGEGQDAIYGDFDYLRFFVSGYNISNCIGVLCNNSGKEMSIPMLERLLEANGRLHTLIGSPVLREFILKEYRPRLTPELHHKADQLVRERQKRVGEKAHALKAFLAAPDWRPEPVFAAEFDAMPEAGRFVSPSNEQLFSVADGCLGVRAHAHTFAYLRFSIERPADGFVVKLRQGSDGGMSWGPAAMARWSNGDGIRIGARANALQADVMGTQVLGPSYDPGTWVWLRARWNDQTGVVEYSKDGAAYERFFTFFRAGNPEERIAELLVGKVPYNGMPQDHTEPGALGECDIDFVRLYSR